MRLPPVDGMVPLHAGEAALHQFNEDVQSIVSYRHPFYTKGDVRIHYEEAESGFPLLVMPGGGLSLPALDEFDNVAIGIFDHGNGGPWPDGGFGPCEDNVLGFQPLDHLVQIGDDKGQVAKAELLVDADGTRARPVRGIDELDITGAKAQAMHGTGGRLVDAGVGEPEQVVIEV